MDCETCEGTKLVPCWSPGGPCPLVDDPECELCGLCRQCEEESE